MTDDYSHDRNTTGVVRAGSSATGALETRGDVDWIKVRLHPGVTYRIDLEGAATRAGDLHDPQLLGIHDQRAERLPDSGDDDSGTGLNSRLFFSAGRHGDHYIDGGAIGGEIEKPGDTDWFAISLEAGALYQVEVRGSSSGDGTLADPFVLGLYADDGRGGIGRRIADTGDNDGGPGTDSLVLFRAPDAGAWYLAVASRLTSGTGTYTVSVTEIHQPGAEAGSAGAVAVGGAPGAAGTGAVVRERRLDGAGVRHALGPLPGRAAAGGKHDAGGVPGDAETGFGMELGGGLRYADAALGLSVETKARTLIAHEDGGYEEWGLSGSVSLDPGRLGRGLALNLNSGWGVAESNARALWQRQTTAGIAPQQAMAAQARFAAEAGYGLDVPWTHGVLTPYTGLEWAGPSRTLRLGWRFTLGQSLRLSLDGERREDGFIRPQHALMLRTSLPW